MSSRTVSITTWGGLILAALGVIIPILWDRFKSSYLLELQQVSSVSLVENHSAAGDEIQILYRGKPVKEVTRMGFLLVNTGNSPIRKDDIVSTPAITLGGDGEVLKAEISDQVPPSVEMKAEVDAAKKTVSLAFPLLNPGDRAMLNLTISGPEQPFTASARIANVKDLTVRKPQPQVQRKSRDWKYWTAAWFTVVYGLGLIVLFREFQWQRRLRKRFAAGYWETYRKATGDELRNFLQMDFKKGGGASKEMRLLTRAVSNVPATAQPTDEQFRELKEAANAVLTEASNAKGAGILLAILTASGLYYLWPLF